MSGCGSCTLCCKVMEVPELEKDAGAWCTHCDKRNGCTVYDARPISCRVFDCIWLQSQKREDEDPMPAELRPDRSHVVLTTGDNDATALVAFVDPQYPDAWQQSVMGRFLRRLIDAKRPVVVIAIGPRRIGFLGGKRVDALVKAPQ